MDADIEALDWLTSDQTATLQQIRDNARAIGKAETTRNHDILMVILASLFLVGQIAGAVL